MNETFIYQNQAAVLDFGIAPGKVSLESDWGNAAVRWTAPSTGTYAFTVAVGGTLASGPGGFGNNFAQYAGVKVNGADAAADSFAGNLKQWAFTVSLLAGATVDTFVRNPGFAAGGNTQTEISISVVPEPADGLLLALGFGVVLLCAKPSARQAATT